MRYVYIGVGFVSLALGAVGAVLPVLPTTPFLLLTAFCFARGSRRFHGWFTGTGLYRRHLESYARDRSMTLQTKLSVLGLVTAVIGAAILLVDVLPARLVLAVVALFHWWYFLFRVKTK